MEDTTDPADAGLPARWTRTDEWYNYNEVRQFVGGTDYSPRNTPGVHVLLKMDESTYAENDGSDGTDDDHPISWCQHYDGGRSFYTGMGHTQATYAEAGFLAHLASGHRDRGRRAGGQGLRRRAGDDPGTDVPVTVGGTVPGVLALSIGTPPSLGTFMPGVAKDYTASVAAKIISSASSAALTVRDPSATATGKLVNGTMALASAAATQRDGRGAPDGRVRSALHHGRGPAAARSGHPRGPGRGDDQPQAVDRRHGEPAPGQLLEDADVHAVFGDALSTSARMGERKSRSPVPNRSRNAASWSAKRRSRVGSAPSSSALNDSKVRRSGASYS